MKTDGAFGFFIDRTLKTIQQAYLRSFAELGVDLTIEQWVILYRIYELGDDASQAEIAKSNYRNRGTTSRVISGLEKKDLIEKDRFEGDNKRYRLRLTPSGERIIHLTDPIAARLRQQGKKGISSEEYEEFLRVLDSIYNNYKNL